MSKNLLSPGSGGSDEKSQRRKKQKQSEENFLVALEATTKSLQDLVVDSGPVNTVAASVVQNIDVPQIEESGIRDENEIIVELPTDIPSHVIADNINVYGYNFDWTRWFNNIDRQLFNSCDIIEVKVNRLFRSDNNDAKVLVDYRNKISSIMVSNVYRIFSTSFPRISEAVDSADDALLRYISSIL